MDLEGKCVFLTGGAKGIGRGLCEALLSKGAKVLFCDVSAENGKATEAELQKQYDAERVSFTQCDVTDTDQLRASFDLVVSKFGRVDICVNNAGILDERIWEKTIEINTIGQIRGCHLALEHMRRDKGGHGGVIINIASMAGLIPCDWFPVYCASKHAIVGFTTSWAKNPKTPELGVRWCCLCPMSVNTDLIAVEDDQVQNVDSLRQRVTDTSMQVEDVVKAFMQLVQDEDNNGLLMEVTRAKGSHYVRRQLVGRGGVSNPVLVDQPPPVISRPKNVT